VFLDVAIPAIRKLVRDITSSAGSSAKQFTKDRTKIEECLLAGVVPHSVGPTPLHPISIVNAAFFFYLTSLPKVITKFEKDKAEFDVEVYSKWTKRLEMWTMKALDDSRLQERFRKLNGAKHGAR
jgi:hypothetical protein